MGTIPLSAPFHRRLWNYALADHLALRFQKAERVACRRLLVGIFLTGLALSFLKNGSLFWPDAPEPWPGLSMVAISGTALLVTAGIVTLAFRFRFKRLRTNFLLSRTLAETLRVDLFQRVAGTGADTCQMFKEQHLRPESSESRPKPPRPHFEELALERAEACGGPDPIPPQDDGIVVAQKFWLEDQRDYFLGPLDKPGASLKAHWKHVRWKRLSQSWVFGAVGFFIVSLTAKALPLLLEVPLHFKTWAAPVGAVAEFGVAVSGLFVAYFHQLAALQAVTAQKYHRAGLYFTTVLERIGTVPDERADRALLQEAARAALAETADWGVHQREHTPDATIR